MHSAHQGSLYSLVYQKGSQPRRVAKIRVALTGIVILVIYVPGALVWTRRHDTDGQRQTTVLLFALYFWVRVFIQRIVVAIAYSLIGR